ncbi:MAG: ABC transporter permease, partial [Caldilineaceae bacterium]|nr:ABC transporter permease [Caldilineaceae bacterium]
MNLEVILHAGLATGTILLFASIGEILAERSGILNLGVEGMMLFGAMAGFSVSLATGNAWFGLAMAMLAAGALSLAHGLVTISFQADQVVSGLSLTFLGTGLALVLGNGLTGQNAALIPNYDIAGLASIPFVGPVFFKDHSPLVYV